MIQRRNVTKEFTWPLCSFVIFANMMKNRLPNMVSFYVSPVFSLDNLRAGDDCGAGLQSWRSGLGEFSLRNLTMARILYKGPRFSKLSTFKPFYGAFVYWNIFFKKTKCETPAEQSVCCWTSVQFLWKTPPHKWIKIKFKDVPDPPCWLETLTVVSFWGSYQWLGKQREKKNIFG